MAESAVGLLIFTSRGSPQRRRDGTAFFLVVCMIKSRRPKALPLRQNGAGSGFLPDAGWAPTGATGGEGTGSLLTHYIHSRNEKIVPPENQKGFR